MKRPLVLLHGLTGSGACWSPVARFLQADFDVLMPDARGHGRSIKPLQGYRYEDHAGDVVNVIREHNLTTPILVGHSMGGMTAAVVAAELGDRVGAVILADPTFLTPQRQREVYESDVADQHRRLLTRTEADILKDLQARHPHRSREMLELLVAARLQTSPKAFDVLTPPNPNYRTLVRAFRVPALIILGDTPVVSMDTARELQTLNPLVQIEQIANAGHGLHYDQPERFAAVVRSFLSEIYPVKLNS